MAYFRPAFQTFFEELKKNNSTEWFQSNKKTYEKEVKAPFAAFVEEMINRIRKYEPEIQIKPADAITRINKDIRFSKDKTPYNTHVAANISVFGKKDKSYPGFYVQLSAEKIAVFGGAYMLEPAQLHTVRSYIAQHQEEFKAVYTASDFKAKFGTLQGEKNKRLPEEFVQPAHEEPLIANKQFYYSAELKPGLLLEDFLADELMEYYQAAKPVNDFLIKALKSA
jgi:uncharacterized protein (TIGR02453 family)